MKKRSIYLLSTTLVIYLSYRNMESINFRYSMKNVLLATKNQYKYKLIEKVEIVLKRMRWKALFFDNTNDNNNTNNTNTNTQNSNQNPRKFTFKSRNCPPQMPGMKEFEEDVYNMVKNINFKKVHSKFQEQLLQVVKRITSSNNVFIPADKTQNYYELKRGIGTGILYGLTPHMTNLLKGKLEKHS